MGVDLYTIGNHNINFKDKTYESLGLEIKEKLDKIVFPNADFLLEDSLKTNRNNPIILDRINKQIEWFYEDEKEYFCSRDDFYYCFVGPFDLEFTITHNSMKFHNGIFRYNYWFNGIDPAERNEWRKYFYTMLVALGGNKVIYLPDQIFALANYTEFECSFAEEEQTLIKEIGLPKLTFEEMIEVVVEGDDLYMIDYFKDIDWDSHFKVIPYENRKKRKLFKIIKYYKPNR